MISSLLFLLAWSVQAEYDTSSALQLSQSMLDEQMVVSVALANVSSNETGHGHGHHHDKDIERVEIDDVDRKKDERKKEVDKKEKDKKHADKKDADKDEDDKDDKDDKEEVEMEEVVNDDEDEDDKDEDKKDGDDDDEEDGEPEDLEEQLEIEQNSSLNGYYRTPEERIHNLISRFVYAKPPRINNHVSKRRPLLFMHQAKSGGTSLRETLYKTSREHRLTAYIPCNGGVKCQKFDIDGHSAAVYGGHFCWKATTNNLFRKGVHSFSCVTIFREPVSRIMSCYSYRLVGQLGRAPSCIARVSPLRLKSKLLENQCVNEPFRRIGDCNVATRLEHHKSDEAQVAAWDTTLSHLAHCAPIILEEPESYKVAAKLFPQFGDAFHKMRQVKLNKNKKYDNRCKATSSHVRAVKEIAGHEIRMYKAAKKRMWRLKEELKVH